MNPLADPLSLPLRDIQLPEPVGWWPPAPLWWVLAGLLLLTALMPALAARWRRHRRLRRAAKRELARLQTGYRLHADHARLAADLSVLLRRVALTLFPTRSCANLSGEAWIAFLNERAGDEIFDRSCAAALTSGPYRRQTEFDAAVLMAACEHWILRVTGRGAPP